MGRVLPVRGRISVDRRGIEASKETERDHLVGRVVADIGAAEIGDSGALAPVRGPPLPRPRRSRGSLGSDVADPAEPDPGERAAPTALPVMWNIARSVAYICSDTSSSSSTWSVRSGSSGVPSSMAEHGDVERGVAAGRLRGPAPAPPATASASQASARATAASPPSRIDVLRHRPVRDVGKAGAIEAGEQEAGVAIAEPGLVARRRRRTAASAARRSGTSHSRRARTRSRRSAGSLATSTKRVGALCVGAGEMIVGEEALRVEDDLDAGMRAARRSRSPAPRPPPVVEAGARRHHCDPHALLPPPRPQ